MTICTFVHIIDGWTLNGTAARPPQTSTSTALTSLTLSLSLTTNSQLLCGTKVPVKIGMSVTIGMDALGRLLVVVYAWRGERVGVISARRATPRERQSYEG